MSELARAARAVSDDPTLARAVTYTPVSGAAVEIRATRAAPDQTLDFGQSVLSRESVIYRVQVADVAAPAEGDTIADGGETRVVQGVPRRDVERVTWTLDTRPA